MFRDGGDVVVFKPVVEQEVIKVGEVLYCEVLANINGEGDTKLSSKHSLRRLLLIIRRKGHWCQGRGRWTAYML